MIRFSLCFTILLLTFATAEASDFFVLDGLNGFYGSSGAPSDVLEKLKEEQGRKTTELKCIAFTPNGDRVVLFGTNGVWTSNTNLPAVKKLTEQWKDPHADFKCVAFAPSGGWVVLWGRNGSWIEGNVPADVSKRIADIRDRGGTLRSIAFAPNGGWVLLCNGAGIYYGGIPRDLVKVLDDAIRNRRIVQCVAFAPNGDWICLADRNWWTSNLGMPASKLIAADMKRGSWPKWVAFVPDDPGSGRYRLETKPSQTVVCTLTVDIAHPDTRVDEWYLYAPQVPNLPNQQAVKTAFVPKGVVVREESPLRRPVILTRITDGRREIRAVLTIQATLMSRRLRALTPGEKVPAVPDLSTEMIKNHIRPTLTLDFTSRSFQAWMSGAGLRRRTGETDMAFAQRAFVYLKHHFHYEWPTPRHTATESCSAGKSDCGGLSAVFASTMRANRVPVRLLCGRWAASQKPGNRTGDYGQWHVKSEFFAHGVGWVPVDAAGAVGDDRGGDFAYFGNDPGDFIAMAGGQDFLLESFVAGKQNIAVFQGVAYWWRGSGADTNSRFEDLWTVRKQRADEN